MKSLAPAGMPSSLPSGAADNAPFRGWSPNLLRYARRDVYEMNAGTLHRQAPHPRKLPPLPNGVAHPPPPPAGEPRERYQEQRTTQSLPVPRQNGMVTSEAYNHMTYYQSDRQGGHVKPWSDRRQQSLPSRRPAEAQKDRQALSAPSRKNRSYSQPRYAPLPKVNTLMAKSASQGGETIPAKNVVTTNFAGISTRESEATHNKNNKFASNWAEVRAQNHIPISSSPGTSPRRDGYEEADRKEGPSPDRKQGPSPDRNRGKGDHSPRKPADTWSPGKENVQPDSPTSQKKEASSSPFLKTKSLEKKKTTEEKPTIRFVMPGEERPQHSRAETHATQSTTATNTTNITTPSDNSTGHSPAPKKRKPPWNNRLNTTSPTIRQQQQHQQEQLQRKSWKRYEAELTHAPEVTTHEQVYRAYTGQSKRQLLHANEAESRPSTSGSMEEGENRQRQEKPVAKEYVLTRNEAKMYIHIQNVYGNDSFRQQRKEWFFRKLSDVQMKDLKDQIEEKRRRRQRKEESRKRQQEQLNYVRRKFKRGQVHRFRTQYVTSRVLEYERGDRDLFGLPDEDDVGATGGSGQKDQAKKGSPPHRSSPEHNDKQAGDVPAAGEAPPSSRSSRPAQNKRAASNVSDQKGNAASGSEEARAKDTGAAVKAGSTPRPNPNPSVPNGRNSEDTSTRANPPARTGRADAKGVAGKAGTSKSVTLPQSNGSDSDQGGSSHNSQQPAGVEATNVEPQSKGGHSPAKSSNANVVNGAKRQDDSKDKNHANSKSVTFKEDGSDQSAAREAGKPANTSSVDKSERETQNTPGKPAPQTNKSQKTNPGQPQQASIDKAANKPSASAGPKANTAGTPAKTASRNNEAENGAKPGVIEKTENPAGKSGLPTDDEDGKKADATPNGIVQNGVHSKGVGDSSARRDTPGKKTTITKDSKGRYITTTKDYRVPDYSRHQASKPATSQGDNEPDSKTGESANNKQAASTQAASQGGKSNPAASHGRHSDAHAGRRKSSHAPETKKQMEQKYGKMFDMNIGRSRKNSAGMKHPKMEGIDTVVVKVTDEKGRKRMQKRQVKDVVKEAKDQLAASDPDSSNRADKGRKQAQTTGIVRTASVDTLDFDDDDDEDDEDVFERVRRKYNLQIDSDDDDDDVTK